jgi:hypothetical protein
VMAGRMDWLVVARGGQMVTDFAEVQLVDQRDLYLLHGLRMDYLELELRAGRMDSLPRLLAD